MSLWDVATSLEVTSHKPHHDVKQTLQATPQKADREAEVREWIKEHFQVTEHLL